jgi:hypothetical protein
MLQSYYAASTVPLHSMALQSYMGIPHLPIPDDEGLRRMKGYTRLKALAEAILSPFGREANLALLSVLIHGQRGVGKKTIAEWVATRLGLHFFEVVPSFGNSNLRSIVMISWVSQIQRQKRICVIVLTEQIRTDRVFYYYDTSMRSRKRGMSLNKDRIQLYVLSWQIVLPKCREMALERNGL